MISFNLLNCNIYCKSEAADLLGSLQFYPPAVLTFIFFLIKVFFI